VSKRRRPISDLIKQWVRAEWEFRLGKRAYQQETAEELLRVEAKLRKAVTGRCGLGDAGEALGKVVSRPTMKCKVLPRKPGRPGLLRRRPKT